MELQIKFLEMIPSFDSTQVGRILVAGVLNLSYFFTKRTNMC